MSNKRPTVLITAGCVPASYLSQALYLKTRSSSCLALCAHQPSFPKAGRGNHPGPVTICNRGMREHIWEHQALTEWQQGACWAMMSCWIWLQAGCGVSSLEIFKSHLHVVLGAVLWVSLLEQGVGPDGARGPFQLSHPVILWKQQGKPDLPNPSGQEGYPSLGLGQVPVHLLPQHPSERWQAGQPRELGLYCPNPLYCVSRQTTREECTAIKQKLSFWSRTGCVFISALKKCCCHCTTAGNQT